VSIVCAVFLGVGAGFFVRTKGPKAALPALIQQSLILPVLAQSADRALADHAACIQRMSHGRPSLFSGALTDRLGRVQLTSL
jgi:hypothetical protein